MSLTDPQLKVLNSLVAGISISEAAKSAGIHRNTVTNWRRQIPEFTSFLEEALEERALHYREELEALSFKALKVLRNILQDEDASPSVRLRAAQAVLKLSSALKTEMMHNAAQPQSIRRPSEPGRNAPCPCQSGLKYKRCCANKPVLPAQDAA